MPKKNNSTPGSRALMRGIRGAVAVAISAFLAELAKLPQLLYLAPILLAIDKYIRDTLKK